MYTIIHTWISKNNNDIPEAGGNVYGLYSSLEEAKIGLNQWIMSTPSDGCKFVKVSDEKCSITSPDRKTKGYVKIVKIEPV